MKVTVLIENSAVEPFTGEHGLSMLIEYKDKRFLLDAGTTDLFLENAKILDAPVYEVDACVLSHGHYDHSGGFDTYLDKNETADVFMMDTATADYYSGSGSIHAIGIPETVLQKHKERFRLIKNITELSEGVFLIPHSTDGLAKIGERAKLYRMEAGELVPDDFSHELSLVFDTESGLVIFNSCSHGGAMNIIREVLKVFPEKRVYAFLGGLHMKGKKDGKEISAFSEEEIAALSEELKETGIQYLYTGHCTGNPAFEILERYMSDQIRKLWTGQVVYL